MTTDFDDMEIHTQADLERMWQLIMGTPPPGLRSLWMVLIDEDARPRPVVVPIDHIPEHPGAVVVGLANVLAGLKQYGEPVLLLCRPGPTAVTENDREWGRALVALTRWPVHLYTRAGVRVLAPDDLAA